MVQEIILIKIIAGTDKKPGWCCFAPGYTVGYLEQELLDDSKTVIEIVREEGVAETMAVLEEFNQINDSFGLPSMKMQIRWTN
jgi:ATPase subunit of ABC transporter with duplicated ATPase domains